MLFPESIRWLLANGKTAQATESILNVAKINSIRIPPGSLESEIAVLEVEPKTSQSFLGLFRHRVLARNTVIIFYIWFSCAMCYYGLAQNTQELPGNAFLTFSLAVLSDVPAYIFSIPLVTYFGRRPTLFLSLGVAGGACILSGFFVQKWLVLSMALLGKMCIAASFAVIILYSAEVFPTVVRQSGTGFSSVFARLGSILAPQIELFDDLFGDWFAVTVYGCVALVAAVLCVFLPETRAKDLPETIEDAVAFHCPTRTPVSEQDQNDTRVLLDDEQT